MDGGDGDGVAESEVVKFVEFGRRRADGVAFVDAQHERLAAFFQHGGDIGIIRRNARREVNDQHDHVSLVNGGLCLTAHTGENAVADPRLNAAGVGQTKRAPAPFAVGEDAVSGHAGRVLYNGQPPSDEFIE